MTRKRGQPERKKRTTKRRKRSLGGRAMRMAGALIARHPSIAGGTASFLVIFGFVSANAVWYQHGAHPAPLFATRDRLASMKAVAVAARKPVTAGLTVDDLLGNSAARAATAKAKSSAAASPDTRQTTSIPPSESGTGSAAPIADIQKALAERGFYRGPMDGRDGVATRAAIEAFQAAGSRPLTGEPSAELLTEIRATHRGAVAVPRPRPGDQPPAADDGIARILATAAPSVPKPAAPPASRASGPAPSGPLPSNMVARIQTGLRNIAYSNVAVDGIAGDRTKAAIRNFEKNYRLPQTGEPSRRVLEKLKSIGAL